MNKRIKIKNTGHAYDAIQINATAVSLVKHEQNVKKKNKNKII